MFFSWVRWVLKCNKVNAKPQMLSPESKTHELCYYFHIRLFTHITFFLYNLSQLVTVLSSW